MSEKDDVRHAVAVANRILTYTGLATGVTASLGHASMRLPSDPNLFYVKGRGYEMDIIGLMRPADMVLCDLDANLIEARPGARQCNEVKMHSCIYKLRPDVQSVVHIHPRHTILMTTLRAPIRPMCQEGIALLRKPLPVWPHVKTVQSDEEGMEIARLLGDSPAMLFRGHGAATTGRTLEQSVMAMYHLEEQARMNWQAYCAVGSKDYDYIETELIDEMTNRAPSSQLPHFQGLIPEPTGGPGALWKYFSNQVSGDI